MMRLSAFNLLDCLGVEICIPLISSGLPAAEAQRQAEWRAEAARTLAEAEALNKDSSSPSISRVPSGSPKAIDSLTAIVNFMLAVEDTLSESPSYIPYFTLIP